MCRDDFLRRGPSLMDFLTCSFSVSILVFHPKWNMIAYL